MVAEMEHMKIYYLRQFKQIASIAPSTDATIIRPQIAPPAYMGKSEASAPGRDASKKSDSLLKEREITWNTKDLDIVIEITPEDISKGDRE